MKSYELKIYDFNGVYDYFGLKKSKYSNIPTVFADNITTFYDINLDDIILFGDIFIRDDGIYYNFKIMSNKYEKLIQSLYIEPFIISNDVRHCYLKIDKNYDDTTDHSYFLKKEVRLLKIKKLLDVLQ